MKKKKLFRRCLTLALAVVMMFGSVMTASAATTLEARYVPDKYTKETKTYTNTYTVGALVKLKSAVYTRTGYTQTGWYMYNGDDADILYSLGQTLIAPHYLNQEYTLVFSPAWTANTYYVKYVDPVSGKSTTKTYTYGKSYVYPSSSTFTRSGYTLKGWSTISGKSTSTTTYPTGSINQPGSRLSNLTSTNKKTITLYAVWQKK